MQIYMRESIYMFTTKDSYYNTRYGRIIFHWALQEHATRKLFVYKAILGDNNVYSR